MKNMFTVPKFCYSHHRATTGGKSRDLYSLREPHGGSWPAAELALGRRPMSLGGSLGAGLRKLGSHYRRRQAGLSHLGPWRMKVMQHSVGHAGDNVAPQRTTQQGKNLANT